MPFNLFSEFNILHPYLSLYYLDYFTMINKMNTKLYCTTALMMSMMNAANATPTNEVFIVISSFVLGLDIMVKKI